MDATLIVIRYIKGTAGLGLSMLAKGPNQLQAFYDSDWGTYV